MHSNLPMPMPASFPALIVGLLLGCSSFFATSDTLSDAQRLMRQGQTAHALEKVDAYLANKPSDAQGRFLKGLALTEMGKQQEAIAVFSKLTEDYPELPETYNNLAVLYAQQKQYESPTETIREGAYGTRDGDQDSSGLRYRLRQPW